MAELRRCSSCHCTFNFDGNRKTCQKCLTKRAAMRKKHTFPHLHEHDPSRSLAASRDVVSNPSSSMSPADEASMNSHSDSDSTVTVPCSPRSTSSLEDADVASDQDPDDNSATRRFSSKAACLGEVERISEIERVSYVLTEYSRPNGLARIRAECHCRKPKARDLSRRAQVAENRKRRPALRGSELKLSKAIGCTRVIEIRELSKYIAILPTRFPSSQLVHLSL